MSNNFLKVVKTLIGMLLIVVTALFLLLLVGCTKQILNTNYLSIFNIINQKYIYFC